MPTNPSPLDPLDPVDALDGVAAPSLPVIPAEDREAVVASRLASDPSHTRKLGGSRYHRKDCPCRSCTRRRDEETFTERLRQERAADDPVAPNTRKKVLNADTGEGMPPSRESILLTRKLKPTPREYVAEWVAMRALEPALTLQDASKRLGIGRPKLSAHITQGVKEGWLLFEDPVSRVTHEIIPTVIDNLKFFLSKGDRQITIEAAKGTIFKTYQEAMGVSDAPQTVLALRIETSMPTGDVKVVTGQVVGRPRLELPPEAAPSEQS